MGRLRTGLISAVAIAVICLLLATPAAATTMPGATLALAVSSPIVAPGGTVTLSGTVTNTSTASEKVAITYGVTSQQCGYAAERTVTLMLRAGQSRSASNDVTAPLCAGDYTITATVRAGTMELDTKSVTVTVAAPAAITAP